MNEPNPEKPTTPSVRETLIELLNESLRPFWRAFRALVLPFLFLAVIVSILEYFPWRFVCEVTSDSPCIKFEFQSAGEQEIARVVNSINCTKVWVWAPHITFGANPPVTLDQVNDKAWILFEGNETSPLVVGEIMIAKGTEVTLDMDGHRMTMTFSSPQGAGVTAIIQVPDSPKSILATNWLMGSESITQKQFARHGGGVVQIGDLRRLSLDVRDDAICNPLVFEQFFKARNLRFNENTKKEWRPVTKGEVRFREVSDAPIKIDGDHIIIPRCADVTMSNLSLHHSSIHADTTSEVASFKVGKTASYAKQVCPSLLDSILKSKFVALLILLCGWLIGAIASSGKVLEAITKSKTS